MFLSREGNIVTYNEKNLQQTFIGEIENGVLDAEINKDKTV